MDYLKYFLEKNNMTMEDFDNLSFEEVNEKLENFSFSELTPEEDRLPL